MTTPQRSATHRPRLPQALALTAAVGLLVSLAGCGAQESSDTNSSGAPSSSASPASTASSTPPAPASSTASSTAAAPSESAPPESIPAAATPLCTAASLTGSLRNDTGGAGAGQLYRSLVVTNTSASDCIVDGYPGVSMIMAGTTSPIGEPAVRDAQAPSNGPITLAPGSAATATLHYTQAGNYQQCQRVEATAILVYPPSATDSLEVPDALTACSNAGINLLTIGAFQP